VTFRSPAELSEHESTDRSASIFRFRLAAACALLVALALVQDAGLLAADTKFDLVAAPVDWLAGSLHLWDTGSGFGQVQNQAYGYLWPMGPAFVLGQALDLPGWVVQRLWQGLVMSVAMVGTAKVARALGIRSDLACLVAGLAFALSPRMLTSLGPISIEVWPSALAPWVLLSLVNGATKCPPRRAAALSALAVTMVGGVNAAATVAVLPVAAIWLLTRAPGPRRRSMMLWWPVFTALGTLWWLVPLVVMGRYSPPFLDFTETAAVTTFPTTIFDTLRGTAHWVPYSDTGSRAGNDLLRTSWIAINSGVLLLLGLAGLLDRRTPHRFFLGLSLLAGVLMVTLGHHGAVQGWFAGPLAEQLDGVLAPLRNLHKFDPVLRLPLVLGLGFMLDHLVLRRRRHAAPRVERVNASVLLAAALVALVGTSTPALTGRIEPAGATLGVPSYWTQAADYLNDESNGAAALLVPGSRFAEYVWGDTSDEPMQWLADSRWAVRNVVGQSEPGTIRMLDGIEQRFTQGLGSAGLTDALRRAGVKHLVVRNDLVRSDDVTDPVLVHQALADSPGIVRVAAFGPDLGGEAHVGEGADRVVVNAGRQARYPAVEIFKVVAPSPPTVSGPEPTVLVGGPEDLPDLLDADVLGASPVQLAADVPDDASRPSRIVLSDGLRSREQSFARVHDGSSAVLTPGDVRRTTNRVSDYLVDGADRWSTTAGLIGAEQISASSSESDADTAGGSRRGSLPYAAVDDALDTAWTSRATDERAWWRLDLGADRAIGSVTVSAPAGMEETLRVRTTHGVSDPVRVTSGGTRRVVLPMGGDGSTEVSWVQVEDASESGDRQLALADVGLGNVQVERVLALPRLPKAWSDPDVIVLRADRDARTGCVDVGADVRCAVGQARTSEDGAVMRRSFALVASGSFDVSVAARPRAGKALDQLVLAGQPVFALASSTGVPDPRAGAAAAVDGDASTAWISDPEDIRPGLRLSWISPEPVTAIDLDLDPDTAARLPDAVRLGFFRDGERVGSVEVTLSADGRATFPAVRADGIRVRALSARPVESVDFDGVSEDVPVGIGEVSVSGVPYLPLSLPSAPVLRACGTGPELRVGGELLRTALYASATDLAAGNEVPAEVCGTVDGAVATAVGPGTIDVTATRSSTADVTRVVLTAVDDTGPGEAPFDAGGDLYDPGDRTLDPAPGASVVALRENANEGWTATQDGRVLDPITLDGWQQGFEVDGDGPVDVQFAPDRDYRRGLLVGGFAMIGLIAVVMATRRRWAGPVPAPLGERRLSPTVAVVVALLAAGLAAGTIGVGVAVAVVAVERLLARRAPDAVPWLLACPVLVAALVYALMPWGSAAGWAGNIAWVGYLSLVPLVAVVVSSARPSGRPKCRFRAIPGSSTKR
jgi:arabinofuranan 3-O-arabinosyltransferase